MTRAAAYVRVSKSDGSQTTDCQLPELQQLARARGWGELAIYSEQASAAKARPVFARMLDDARRGAFQALAVWSIDRFGRSMAGNMADIAELDRLGVAVVSVRESWLDTGGPTRALLVAIVSWVAEQERARLISRTKAGLAVARAKGHRIGRPPLSPVTIGAIRARYAAGESLNSISKALKISRPAATKYAQGA